MPVSTPHPDYLYRKGDWAKIRAFAEGARAVRAQGEAFLPKIKGWTDEEFNAYKSRAEVYGAVDRTIDGLDGAIFRKAPQLTGLDGADGEAILTDITLSGKTPIEWLRGMVREVVTVGRRGVLVDFTGVGQTLAGDVRRPTAGDRPYAVDYTAEQIINWDTEVQDGVTKLVLVVLQESEMVIDATDPFVRVPVRRFRVLRLDEGVYSVELWKEKQKTAVSPGAMQTGSVAQQVEYEKVAAFTPSRRGTPLSEIPFFFIGPSGQEPTPEKPPLLDITDLCILHYMTSADYAHGLHWVGLPTPYVCGSNDKDTLAIGPSKAIILDDPTAKVGMLEFTGTGLGAVKDRLEGLERKMAALGARILEEQKRQAESGDALKLRQGGDASVLAGISDAVSRAAEAIVARMLWWAGTGLDEPKDVEIALNMDFFGQPMDPQLITALMQAQQAGLMSKETFVWNLKRGEMMPEDRTIDDELSKIDTDPPPAMGGTGGVAA
jgi:hypothetical protein